jgi:hypothetical protein
MTKIMGHHPNSNNIGKFPRIITITVIIVIINNKIIKRKL